MIRRFLCLLLCLLLCGCAASEKTETAGIAFTDDTGAEITLQRKPERVAVLLSSLADLWVTAGGTVDITVGETVERGFASENAILVDAGAGKTVNLEALIAAEPDFVLYASDIAGQLDCAETLRAAGIPAAGFAVETFAAYLELLKIATDILETPENYERYGTRVQQRVEALLEDARSREVQPSVLFVRAGSSAKFTKAKTAENHFACVMLRDLGTCNIADKAPILLDGLSIEEILLSNPDCILFTTMGDETAGVAYMNSLVEDSVWQSLRAVREGRVFQLPKDLFQYKPNSRWDEAYAYLIALLYGETV